MDKAKAAISDFVGRSGHHDTTVHETVAPSVQKETVKPHQHEEINTAVDREVHQDHYHRTIQPVHDREVLPEQHTAKLGSVQHREFDHRDHDATKRNLQAEQAQFKDESIVAPTTTSRSVAPAVGGEHQHHHIHETIQPVIHKETVQPNVVHTTVPIHEVHHNKATHHETTALPAMTMDQFKQKGGALSGREERYDEFEGLPKNIGGSSGAGVGSGHGLHHHTKDDAHHGHQHSSAGTGAISERDRLAGQGTSGSPTSGYGTDQRSVPGQSDLSGTKTKQDMAAVEQHHQSDRGFAGQGNLTGSSTQGGVASTQSPGSNNNTSNRSDQISSPSKGDGSGDVLRDVDLKHSHMKKQDADDGELPKALTEDKSHFVPYADRHPDDPKGEHIHDRDHKGHSKSDSVHESGDKPSIKDKLNPKVDSDGDGKAGIMS